MTTLNIPQNKSLLTKKDISISLKFGYIGLGMGGCAIASECAEIKAGGKTNAYYPYTGLLVNTNVQDFKKLRYENKQIATLQLKGFDKGAGRDVKVGERAFLAHKDAFLQAVERHFENRDFLWVVCGLGGGTGTGSILQVVNLLHQKGYKGRFGLILILPRDGEGTKVFQNALGRLQKIAQAMKHIGSILLVDNNKLYREFFEEHDNVSLEDYTNYANRYIASLLHEINVLTSSFQPKGENHFDSSEFENMIKTPGILHVSKATIEDAQADLSNELSYKNDIQNSIEKGTLAHADNLNKASRSALSVLSGEATAERMYQLTFTHELEDILNDYTPYAEEKPVSLYADNETKQIHVYGMFAGLDLPKRIKELVEETEKLVYERSNLFEGGNDVWDALASYTQPTEENAEEEVDELFSSDEPAPKKKKDDKKESDEVDIFDIDY